MAGEAAAAPAGYAKDRWLRTALRNTRWGERLFYGLTALALSVGLVSRLLVGWNAPLWLDETYTGAIALRPTASGLREDILKELGGPVYYSFMWLWVKLSGSGDTALRIPSFLFAVAAPMVILWRGHPDRRLRFSWAAISATWLPGFYYATEARSYSLLFLLGSIQVICFAGLLKAANLRSASSWALVSSIMILTHTHGVIITGLQGLMLVMVHRRRLLTLWPAALLLLPPALWFLIRLPLLMRFSDPKATWLRLLEPLQLFGLPELLLDAGPASLFIVAGVLGAGLRWIGEVKKGSGETELSRTDWLPVLASVTAIALVIALGFIKPSFTFRYLIPFMPGFLFGIALVIRGAGGWLPANVLLASFSLLAAAETARRASDPKLDMRLGYSWEKASDYLKSEKVDRLIFVWDNPTATGGDASQLGRVGAFFLHRDGLPVVGDAVTIGSGSDDDFRRAIFAASSVRPAKHQTVGVITLGRILPLSQPGADWRCRRYGGREAAYAADVYVTACVRRPL